MKTARQIGWDFFSKHRRRLGIAFATGLLARMVAIAIPLVIGRHLALRYGYASLRSKVFEDIPQAWFLEIEPFLILLMVLATLWFVLGYLERFHTRMSGELLAKELREDLFQAQLATSPEAFAQRSTGKYLLRYSGDLKQIQNLFSLGVLAFVRDLIILIPAFVLFAFLLPELVLPVVLALVLVLLPLGFLNRLLYRASTKRRDRRSGLLSFVSDRLYRHGSIQVLNREKPEMGKFAKRSSRLMEAGKHYFKVEALIRTLIPGLLYLLPGMVFLWLEWGGENIAELNPEALSLGALLILGMVPIIRRFTRVSIHWQLGMLSIRKYLRVLNMPRAEVEGMMDLDWDEGKLTLDACTTGLGHPISARIGPVGLTWFHGGTGIGKTGLIRLFLGLEAPAQGTISIDGQDIQTCSQRSVRKRIAVVSNAWPLVGKTVFEAISYSRKAEKRPSAQKMLDKLQRGRLNQQLLNLDDVIGEQGSLLSGGQNRILLWARALLTRKPILILDEPFLHLDDLGKSVVADRINRLRTKRNIIVFSVNPPGDEVTPDQTISMQAGTEQEPERKIKRIG